MLKNEGQVLLQQLVHEVLTSTKYQGICLDLVQSIGAQELAKRRTFKEALKATKNKLHQVSGAYLEGRQKYVTWAEELRLAAQSRDPLIFRQACQHIMGHHASTRERLPILDQFYATLMEPFSPIHSVLDIACGLNPLTAPWMPLTPSTAYYACDIYHPMIDFLNDYMNVAALQGEAITCDVLRSCPNYEVEVALLLKALPCLEQIDKQAGHRLLRSVNARHLIVSFPIYSLGGRTRGMVHHYEQHFYELVSDTQWEITKFEFATELVFVVTK